ncbi:glycosyl transferase family 90 [Vibrio ulleungensis]|uniref:Lipopolysaccharide A protein n=1 Tax=Vibrio ulleungensis TaxID=2807619 RepID=A0ABS2HNQ0_9VIBR|nr:glycosyl transferase family 90 [Vibrio ulleungensis]MBM7037679.1 lipopolysaccharide A protein [Vibrio ulleungensis]
MKVLYYLNNVSRRLVPRVVYAFRLRQLKKKYLNSEQDIRSRVDYYMKGEEHFACDDSFQKIADFKRRGFSAYFYDLKSYLFYFDKKLRFKKHFGDETHIESLPTFFKARPIAGDNRNSVLLKLDKYRHFKFVDDKRSFGSKHNKAVFRGTVYQKHRIAFMESMFSHPMVDAGQSNPSDEHPEWQQPFMSKEEQLENKFIICLEGNDVATNLKWAMSSNSLVITPPMKFETWFMEGTLVPGIHYVEVNPDFSDLEEKMNYYNEHIDEALTIIDNAHKHVQKFLDDDLEELIGICVVEKYFALSDQLEQ